MVKINIPNDFSQDVEGRNCEWEFPEWEIPDENIYEGGMEFWDEPDICKNCPHIRGCKMQVSLIIMMPELLGGKDDFNIMSNIFALMGNMPDFWLDTLERWRVIDGEFQEIVIPRLLFEGKVDDSEVSNSNVIDVNDIPNVRSFLTELRDKWLIGLANYNNGTMYYVPENAIWEYKSKMWIWSISISLWDEIESGTKSFAWTLWSAATQNIEHVFVLQDGKYIETTSNDDTFDVLDKHPECIKISWLTKWQLEARLILYTTDDKWVITALNFVNKEWLPYDLKWARYVWGQAFQAF